MRILGLSGSLRSESANTALLRAVAKLAPSGVATPLFEGMDALPHFSPERDTDEPPASVRALREALRAADAILVCTPEYAHGMPGSLKNLLDWVVGSGELVEKPVGLLSGSPSASGGAFAHAQLLEVLGVMNTALVPEACFTIPSIRTKVRNDTVVDADLEARLRGALAALVAAAQARA
ncbi:MAG TPA: NAD(P)H-dependent oxidoreductase [Holophagaceae bacterium]|nr:NAD(P)H-dependent oxidoreductase [Holophagaceae bacterium]